MVTPLGLDRESSWLGLRQGRGALAWLEQPDLTPVTPHERRRAPGRFAGAPVAGPVAAGASDAGGQGAGSVLPPGWQDPAAPHALESAGWPVTDPVIAFAERAAAEALADAGLDLAQADRRRIGCVVGTSKGGLRSFAVGQRDGHFRQDKSELGAELWRQFLPGAAASRIAARYDLGAAALCPVAACATGLVSIARGADLIRFGQCDAVLAGSSDASLQPVLLASFQRLGVLARNFDEPSSACRPFDRRRNGFLVGEGAALLVLENAAHARGRGARVYGEWLAGGVASDASHLTGLADDAGSLTRLISELLRAADLSPGEVDYINLHGTATRQNDLIETRALQSALGAAARQIPCSTLKGTIGHLLGAAGSVELAATLLAMRDGIIPPTLNLTHPDPDCDLDYTPLVAQPRRIETALKLSLGFGGHLAAAIVRTAD